MATKEVMIVTPDEMKNLVPSERAIDAYKFAIAHAGVEMDEGAEADFVAQRNAKAEGFRDLAEVQKWMEKTAVSIKTATKHAFNVGDPDELPNGIKWSKQSYSYEWQDDAGPFQVVQDLIAKNLVTVDQLVQQLTVSMVAKAAGVNQEKIMEMFPQYVCAKHKDRTFSIK